MKYFFDEEIGCYVDEDGFPVSDSMQKALCYDKLMLNLPKGFKDELKELSKDLGFRSMSSFIVECINYCRQEFELSNITFEKEYYFEQPKIVKLDE